MVGMTHLRSCRERRIVEAPRKQLVNKRLDPIPDLACPAGWKMSIRLACRGVSTLLVVGVPVRGGNELLRSALAREPAGFDLIVMIDKPAHSQHALVGEEEE